MSADWNERWAPAARKVAEAETEDFARLIKLGGLDPARHLQFADWAGLDFSGRDLRGFDFTGARLLGCDFSGALIAGARFDQAEIDRQQSMSKHGTDWGSPWGSPWTKKPPRRTDLRAAGDWAEHLSGWRRPERPVNDAHLRPGTVFIDAPFAPEMVVIPPGEFVMGSPPDEPGRDENEGPQHLVTIPRSFRLGVSP